MVQHRHLMRRDKRSRRIRQSQGQDSGRARERQKAPLAEEAGGALIYAAGPVLKHSELRGVGRQTQGIAAVYFQICKRFVSLARRVFALF